ETDAGHDLRGDTRRVDARLRRFERREAVDADEREETRTDRDQDVRAQTGCLVAHLTLDADRRAGGGGNGEANENFDLDVIQACHFDTSPIGEPLRKGAGR